MEEKQNLWFHKSVDETKEYFKLDEENGLSNEQVNERIRHWAWLSRMLA